MQPDLLTAAEALIASQHVDSSDTALVGADELAALAEAVAVASREIRVHPDILRCLLKFGGPNCEANRATWAVSVNNARDVLARHGMDE